MHSFTKNYIDSVVGKAVLYMPIIKLVPLTDEDIAQYKKDFKEEKFRSHVPKKSIPPKPLPKKLKLNKKGKDVLKLVLSREGKTDQFKSHFKSVKNCQKNKNSTPPLSTASSVCSNSIENTIITSDESIESTSFNSLIGTIRICDFKTLMDDAMYKRYVRLFLQNNTNNLINNNLINIVTPDIPLNTIISVQKDKLTLTDIENLYMKYFSKSVQDTIVVIASILNIISISNIHHKARMDESFKKRTEAEKLKERVDANRMHMRHKKVLEMKLKKYFVDVVTSFDDYEFDHAFQMFFLSILTVLRVLDPPKFKKGSIFKNLILLLLNSLKCSEYEDPKIFGMFRDKKFRPACIDLISLIEDSRDNDPCITDRMAIFFLSSINDREYFQPVIDAVTGDSNEDLGLLIDSAASQCFFNSKFKDPINTLLKKNISSNNIDDQIHWVIAKASNGNYQPIPITSESRPPKTARITIDPAKAGHHLNSFYEPFYNSLLKSPVSSESVVSKAIAPKMNVVTPRTIANGTITSKLNFITPTTLDNCSIAPKISVVAPTTLVNCSNAPKFSIVAPTTLANGSFTPNLSVVTPTTLANGSISSKLNVIAPTTHSNSSIAPKLSVIAPTTLANGSMTQAATLMSFKSAIKNIRNIPTTSIQKTDGNTIFVGNKQFQLVRGPLRTVSPKTNNIIFKTPQNPLNPVVPNVKCYAKNCKSNATIMCSTCTSVKYCSHNCQRQDWYDSHINNCQNLLKLRQIRTTNK